MERQARQLYCCTAGEEAQACVVLCTKHMTIVAELPRNCHAAGELEEVCAPVLPVFEAHLQ